MPSMSYVSSGQFRADIEKVTGQTLTRDADASEESVPLSDFSPELRTELQALHDLLQNWSPPKLCVLTWGDFYPVPELTGEVRDAVLEDWFDGDEAATDFMMRAVDIVNGGGGFYIVVNRDGRMGLVCEDPYSFDPLECRLPQFLQALVAAHRAACTQGIEAAKAELGKAVGERTAKLLLTFAQRLTPKAS